MSVMHSSEPECTKSDEPSVELAIQARTRSLAKGLSVRRLLPSRERNMVGPFIFFDHMGPVQMEPGRGLDVIPHPHINLATVTYLFAGEFLHRDSLGSEQLIRPAELNWMTAGRGIVHSERTPVAARKTGPLVHGLQLWVALPKALEESEPSFQHHPFGDIPALDHRGSRLRVIAGSAYGAVSPVQILSRLFYVEARLEPRAELPVPGEYAERALYIVDGLVTSNGIAYGAGTMLVFREGVDVCVAAVEASHVMLLGGDPLDGPRYIWWNFVSSSRSRIERAKEEWLARRFPNVPGDGLERMPLPSVR